jgi:hypothetical protein
MNTIEPPRDVFFCWTSSFATCVEQRTASRKAIQVIEPARLMSPRTLYEASTVSSTLMDVETADVAIRAFRSISLADATTQTL